MQSLKTESVVKSRYAAGAKAREPELCCPVIYDTRFLKVIPQEVIDRDYGCGDPSKYVQTGETVLDLGSGTGKICFIASQVVGPTGKVIGVDMTDDMLEVARRNAPIVAERIGYANVEFRKGRIQDLGLDLEALEEELREQPVSDANGFLRALDVAEDLRDRRPLVADASVDVVVSNCVLNLVHNRDRQQLFAEIFRVLKVGGRAVISDIVGDEDVPQELQDDPDLWSGCISGAFREDKFLEAFEAAGFYGVRILKLDRDPWRTVKGFEFRSMTVEAFKGSPGRGLEMNQAVIYRGPFKKVLDDEGQAMERGVRYAVSDKTFKRFQMAPYKSHFECVPPLSPVPLAEAKAFSPGGAARVRHPRETKGQEYDATSVEASCCGSGGTNCC